MSQKVFNIIIKMVKEGGADKDTIRGLTEIKTAMTQGMAVAGAMVGAYYAIDKILDATVGKYITLATAVEKFHNQSGMSMQDSSRLVEVMGDLEISAEEVGTAFKFAEKNGFQPTIESLKDMQTEYLALAPGMERTQFLMKEFGKSGLNLQKFFETGDIVQRLEEVNQGLIIDDKARQSIQEYKDALDGVKDLVNAVSMSLGKIFLPVSTAFLKSLEDSGTATTHQQRALLYLKDALDDGRISVERYDEAVKKINAETQENADIVGRDTREYHTFTQAEIEAAQASKNLYMTLAEQGGWEAAYTGAETAADKTKMSAELMRKALQELGDDGANVWDQYLISTGEISPAAIAEFVKIQAAFEQVRKWLASGMSIPIITNFLTYTLTGSGPQTGTTGGSGWHKIGIVGMGSNPNAEVWENALGQRNIGGPGKATGGIFSEDIARVGENGEEWLVRTPGGGVVVLPNDMVQRMRAWGITPGMGFAGGGWIPDDYQVATQNSRPGWKPPTVIQRSGIYQGLPSAGSPGWVNPHPENPNNLANYTNPYSGGGAAGPSSTVISRVSAMAAVEAIAPAVTGSMQTFQAASRESTDQSVRQTAAVQQASAQQTALLRLILNAIEGQPEQLAAEIQKRR